MRKVLWCLALAALTLAASPSTDQEPAPSPLPPLTYSCEVPYDVTSIAGKFSRQREFDIYSWNIFIALNWPADTSTKGAPPCNLQNGVARDCDKPLPRGDYGPTVWETFRPDWSVFRGDAKGAVAPAGWNCPLDPLPGCDSLEERDAVEARLPVLRMIMKDANTAQEFLQAGTFAPLIDQNGSFVRYELRMNRDEFEFIDRNQFWNSDNLKADVNFQPAGSNDDKTMGPIEIKAAWKILPAPSERYHSRAVEIAWPDPAKKGSFQCKQYTMGLVGLHIAHKTKTAPQWIWSTFEQVDNYSGDHPSFANPNCPASQCPPNLQPTPPGGGKWSGDPRIKQTPPTQVVVVNSSPAEVRDEALNAEVREKLASLGSVWQYYELVSTQWPAVPYIGEGDQRVPAPVYKSSPIGKPSGALQTPHKLGNTTMETYLMGPGGKPEDQSSCMYCHSIAMDSDFDFKTDFSYLLQEAYPAAAGNQLAEKRRAQLSKAFHLNTAAGGQKTKAVPPKK
ncbi:MAG TPA: hypothetical protein VMU84_03095 [Thermoanaerobaculia bacterium]|nr:hypothetical protein [Thermoanaerobaculia bacterium]